MKLRIMKYVKFWLQFIINQLKYLFTINCIILRVHQHQSQIFKVLKSDYIYYTLTSYCPKEVICQNAIDRFSKGYLIFLPAGYTSPVGGSIYQCSRSAIKHRRRRPITVTLFWSLWFQRYCNLSVSDIWKLSFIQLLCTITILPIHYGTIQSKFLPEVTDVKCA